MNRTLDNTLDALRRVRDARQRKAAIEKIRQERVAAQTAQTVANAQSRMMSEIAARMALAQRVNREAGSGGVITPRALADTFTEDMSRTRAAGLARLDVMRAGDAHRREQATLAELQQRLGRAQANLEKIDRVAQDMNRTAQRRANAREDDEADAAALRRGGQARAASGEPDADEDPTSWMRDADGS
jgi:truncated hemoglobin YjbI